MFGVTRLTLDDDAESMRGDEDFFSVARTIPLVAAVLRQFLTLQSQLVNLPLIPSDVTPWLTALSAYSAQMLVSPRRSQPAPAVDNRRRTNLHQLSAVVILAGEPRAIAAGRE